MTAHPMPWRRYAALGDSFTEGIGDPNPAVPGGYAGWADRVAAVLAASQPEFRYANLAVRGKLIEQIIAQQVEPAIALAPDLITLSAGGNDVIRPNTDPDAIAARLEYAVRRLTVTGATIVVFTGVDVGFAPLLRRIRGKVAVYNENIRGIAAAHGCRIADQWSLTEIQDARMWSADRLHLNPLGHRTVARMVLATLGMNDKAPPPLPEPLQLTPWRVARRADMEWAREYLAPWIGRRLRRVSSGDTVRPKRPTWSTVSAVASGAALLPRTSSA